MLSNSLKKIFLNINSSKGYLKDNRIFILIFFYSFLLRTAVLIISNPIIDDFFITLRVAKNFINGNGLVYNAGEKIISSTSSLYAIFCSIFLYLFDNNAILIIRIVLALFDAMTASLIYLTINRILQKDLKCDLSKKIKILLSIVGALIYSSFSTVISSNLRGLETSIYIFLIAISIYLYENKKFSLSFLTACISFITRPDGLILVVIFLLIFINKGIDWKRLIPGIIVIIIYFAIVYFEYNKIIPQSVIAKNFVKRDFIDQWLFFISKFFISEKSFFLGISFILGIYLCIKNKFLFLLHFWGLAYVFTFSTFGAWWPWYLPPFVYYYSITIVLGFVNILIAINNQKVQKLLILIFSIIPILLLLQSLHQEIVKYSDRSFFELNFKKNIALYLKAVSQPEDIISLEPIGIIGYYCFERKFIDYPGLISDEPTNIWATKNLKIKGNLTDSLACKFFLQKIKPDFLILRKNELTANNNNVELLNYTIIKEFNLPEKYKDLKLDYAHMIVLKRLK